MISRGLRLRICGLVLVAAQCLCGARSIASVEEAHSYAMEAAETHLKAGFNIRGESWDGAIKPGKRKVVKHQLFRGNEYWFWLGSSKKNSKLTLKIYDRKGRPVHVETVSGENWVATRVLAPRTGTYLVVVSGGEGKDDIDWSLSYGYR
jgi:hypothetical protein